jgi:hypothetical protein
MIKKSIFSLTFLLIVCTSFTQKMRITGFVQDTIDGKPLKNALAMVVRIKDSVLVDFKRTDANGNFAFSLPIDTVQLVVSHPRFNETSYYIFGSKSNYEFDIKKIVLPQVSQQLKEVVIYAYKEPVFYKGDTLVYVADSFATKPNAVVEDLLKKLPGIKVNADGSIQAQGKDIQQVLVDGDEFFGADPTMATKNLAAKGVETVEIYEKKDENATDDSETIQVLNLKLKDEAKKGYFGKISGASDVGISPTYNSFYEGELLLNKFNKKQKISIFSLASNTMKSSLEWRDMYKYGLADRGGWNEEEDTWNWNFSGGQGDGIPRTFKSGVYFNDQISKKTNLNVNYTYTNSELRTKQTNLSQYFLADTSYVTDLVSTQEEKSESHEMNMKLVTNLDSMSVLEIEPKVKLNKLKTNSFDNTNFISEDNLIARNTGVNNENLAEGMNISTRISYRRNFKKKGRKLTSFYRFGYDKNASDGKLDITDTQFFSDANQSKENASLSTSHTASISYIEPIFKFVKWETEYEFYNNFNDQLKLTNDIDSQGNESINTFLSNSFETSKNQHRVGTQLIYEYKKHRLSGGLRVRNVVIENRNLMTNTQINQDITNYLPRARYVYKISQHNRFVLNYSTSSSQPSINQLQPVFDNTNPNRLQAGNPNLRPNFSHNFSSNYSFYKPLSGTHFWSSMNYSLVQDAFANSTTFDNLGRMTSQTINVDGNASASVNMGGGFPLFNKFIEVFPNLNYAYSKSKSFINGAENLTINQNIGGGLEFRIEKDSLEFTLGTDYAYIMPSSTISSQSNLPYASQSFDGRFLWKLPKGFFIETDARYTLNTRRAQGYNINFFIWNASISKSFLKNENLFFAFEVNDILDQNLSANRFVNSNVITDTRSTIISRYFMFRLTYKFNSTKTKESDDFF